MTEDKGIRKKETKLEELAADVLDIARGRLLVNLRYNSMTDRHIMAAFPQTDASFTMIRLSYSEHTATQRNG